METCMYTLEVRNKKFQTSKIEKYPSMEVGNE